MIVTPRMHGIHRSVVDQERDSNSSSGLSVWDRLHGKLKLDVPQHAIMVGVPGYERDLGLPQLLALPFVQKSERRAMAAGWAGV